MTARRSPSVKSPEQTPSQSTYREFRPSQSLSPFVECFWTREVSNRSTSIILPDGCVDAIFFLHRSGEIQANVIGTMTVPQRVTLEGDQAILGIRFHPGMAGICLPVDIPRLTDRSAPLQTILGTDVHDFLSDLGSNHSIERKIEDLERRVGRLPQVTAIHTAIGELVGQRGQLSVESLADLASVSPRQLQRTCLKHSGLSPKRLSRVLRFRHAAGLLRKCQASDASIAAECGYFDQSHMIRDFQELAGLSPDEFVRYRA